MKRKNFQYKHFYESQLRRISTSSLGSIKMEWFQISRRLVRIRFSFKYSTIPLWYFIHFPNASKTKTANMKISSIGHHRHRRICLRVFEIYLYLRVWLCAILVYISLYNLCVEIAIIQIQLFELKKFHHVRHLLPHSRNIHSIIKCRAGGIIPFSILCIGLICWLT